MTHRSAPMQLLGLCMAILIGLAGCAAPRSHDMLSAEPAGPGDIVASHRIFVATTREKAADPSEIYGGQRSETLGLARLDVTIPAAHRTGSIERPPGRRPADPARHFVARDIGVFPTDAAFSRDLRASLARQNGRALVFIHGYRTLFDTSVYRMAQVVHDAGYQGTPVLFSWASAGRTLDYIYDNNSATIARDGLEETLLLLVEAGATRIDLIAHSMGNWVMMEALRQLAISGDHRIRDRLGDVLLASPDLDVDVFRSQMQRIGEPRTSFTIMLSGDDRALQVSSILAGNRPRLGDYSDAASLAALGVTVVNVSQISAGDRLNHAKFADNPVLIQLLGDRLAENDALTAGPRTIEDRITQLTSGIGQTIGSAAEIIVTTPLEVISIAVGG